MPNEAPWPEGVAVPLKYKASGQRCVPFYVRQINGPKPFMEDRVIWCIGPGKAKSIFLEPTKGKAYMFDLAAIPIDPDGPLAEKTKPPVVNMKIARKWWADKQKEQAIYRRQQGLDEDGNPIVEEEPAKRGPGRPRKTEQVS